MRLIHVRIQFPGGLGSPEWLRRAFLSHAGPEQKVDHISIHPGDEGELTVGFFVTAASLIEAEAISYTVAHRALSHEPALQHARITSYSAAMVPDLFDRMLDEAQTGGRNMRRPDEVSREG
ncbi:hypothetical protein SLUN_01155 [Streptomyces lunaelactis]|uniref:Uncharacterized protein n=1 Tax=Streptomyces lunaelactis TaxID=1535768 RepID=A0A2R4SW38_9ACTN|nr:hypothetical protein [Streptomyces lunaelactis]AVZ71064.1 hypothetical protein SLUN_01155 [Streptomyces lunaelactis]NUK22647.1 hypothetical protein [Streptomyces lunaelactis]NUK87039.1 hypothetical protein [Streptomyces lunaelactis]